MSGMSAELETGLNIEGGTDGTTIGNAGNRLLINTSPQTLVSTNNSGSGSLAANAVFTGTADDVSTYGNITVGIYSPVAGTFTVQWSSDAATWRDDGDIYTITPGTMKSTSYGPKAQYFRLIYTNGASIANPLTLQTILRTNHTKPSSHKVSEAISDNSDAELSKAVITARMPSGSYGNVELSNNNDLSTADILDSGGVSAALTVGTSAVLACAGGAAANLVNRKALTILNNGTVTVYWGLSNAVTTTSGTPLVKGQFLSLAAGPNTTVYLISGSASQNTRIAEMA